MGFRNFLENYVRKYCETHEVENDESLIWDYVYDLKEDIQKAVVDYFDLFYDEYIADELFDIIKDRLN